MCYLKAYIPLTNHTGPCVSGTRPGVKPTPGPAPPAPPPLPPFPPIPPNAKNVLFIAVDDLRPELGAYNFKHHPPTPNLDAFAKTALRFNRAYVQYSFCCPSRYVPSIHPLHAQWHGHHRTPAFPGQERVGAAGPLTYNLSVRPSTEQQPLKHVLIFTPLCRNSFMSGRRPSKTKV
jgi:hypothetical protein